MINYQPLYETYIYNVFLVPETLDMVVRTLKIERKLGYRRWSKSGTIKKPDGTQHHIVPPQLGSRLLMSPRISVFPPPGDARLVLVGFSDARSVESKRVAPPSIAGFYQPGGDACCATEKFFGLDFGRTTSLHLARCMPRGAGNDRDS